MFFVLDRSSLLWPVPFRLNQFDKVLKALIARGCKQSTAKSRLMHICLTRDQVTPNDFTGSRQNQGLRKAKFQEFPLQQPIST
jgi:hypothetical protein